MAAQTARSLVREMYALHQVVLRLADGSETVPVAQIVPTAIALEQMDGIREMLRAERMVEEK